ncbi:hypothetical protein OAK19_00525 [Aureispira]|nr:hypothetical protein [Aureispira sp.]
MEHTEQLDSGITDELSISTASQDFLLTTCKWTKFLAILGFIFIGFMILGIVSFFLIGQAFSSGAGGGIAGMGMMLMPIYLLIIAVNFYPTRFLYRFSTLTKDGIENNSNDLITSGFENLKSFFKFIGMLMAIILGIYFSVGLYWFMAGLR